MAKVEPVIIPAKLPEFAAAAIAGLGPAFNPESFEATRRLLEGARKDDQPSAVERVVDVPYGTHPRQRLDVYRAEGEGRPVLVFIPGGGFVGGDKARYPSVGSFFAAAGFLTVVANYRLAPEVSYPAGSEDVASVVRWVRENAKQWGGDPEAIVLMGHSAGASHVATAVLETDVQCSLAALVLASGLYQLVGRDLEAGVEQYFGADRSQYPARQVVGRARALPMPVILFRGEHEPANLSEDSATLAKEWAAAGSSVRFSQFEGHNHISLVLGMQMPGHLVGDVLVDTLKNTILSRA